MKTFPIFLLTFFLTLSLGFLYPTPTLAQTSTESLILKLQEQVKLLQSQIEELKSQVSSTKTELELVKTELKFTKALKLGTRGEEVTQLQEFLKKFPDIYPQGLVTGYFGPLTEAAVRKFQESHGIETVGVVGPKTLSKLNELITEGAGSSGVVPPGLLIAPGIQGRIATTPSTSSGQATATTPFVATTTPTIIATSTVSQATTTPSVTTPATPATPTSVSGAPTVSATPAAPAQPATTTTAETTTVAVKIISPNSGEQWQRGTSYTISWNNPLAAGFVGATTYKWLASIQRGATTWVGGYVPVTQSYFNWTQWANWSELILDASDYKARVDLVRNCVFDPDALCPEVNQIANWTVAPSDCQTGGSSLRTSDCSDGTLSITSPIVLPAPTMGSGGSGWSYTWQDVRDNTISQSISFSYPLNNISQTKSFRLYQKRPSDSSYSNVLEFQASGCALQYGGEWTGVANSCIGGNVYIGISHVKTSVSSYTPGEYAYYLAAIDTNGTEGLSSPIVKMVFLQQATMTFPTVAQSPTSRTPTFQWTAGSDWPATLPDWPSGLPINVVVFDGITVQNYFWISGAVYSGTSKVYSGPTLEVGKKYYAAVFMEVNDNTRHISHLIAPTAINEFWVSTSTSSLNTQSKNLSAISQMLNSLDEMIKQLSKILK